MAAGDEHRSSCALHSERTAISDEISAHAKCHFCDSEFSETSMLVDTKGSSDAGGELVSIHSRAATGRLTIASVGRAAIDMVARSNFIVASDCRVETTISACLMESSGRTSFSVNAFPADEGFNFALQPCSTAFLHLTLGGCCRSR